jgi:hypothetical protein
VMDAVFTVQVLLKGHLGKSVASAVELFHRRLEFLSRFGCDNQFGFYRKVNAHVSNISRLLYLRKGRRIPLHGEGVVTGWYWAL